MTHKHIKALNALIAAVESGGDTIQPNIHIKAAHAFPPENAYGKCTFHEVARAFYGSLDASKALHEKLLPDLLWEITPLGSVYIRNIEYNQIYRSFVTRSPARAWLIAILKAYRAQMDA